MTTAPTACRSEHVNPSFLAYRKSVAEGRDFAAIEWTDGEPGGATVKDAHGKEYIDCLGGYGIYNVGHSHPKVVAAVQAQLAKQPLHSQELLDPLRAYAAALLAAVTPGDLKYSFFINSGAEAVEACLKMAMLATGRRHFLGVLGAFHGKTLGALSGTSKSVFRKPFGGGLLPFSHVPVNDCAALTRAFEAAKFTGNELAGLMIEPVLGEGGIYVCTDEFLRTARRLCDEHGACLIFDEVQSGMGRTGKWWACQHAGVAPDLMAIGKAFGGGVMPAAACIGTRKVWEKYMENPFLLTTTFGGNPLAMAASIAAMSVLHEEGLVEAAAAKGDYFMSELRRLAASHPRIIKTVRGRGLMIGLEFPNDAIGYAFARGGFSSGVLMAGTLVNSRVIRIEPPLTITREQIDTVIARFERVLAAMEADASLDLAPQAAPAVPTAAAASVAASAAAAPPVSGGAGRATGVLDAKAALVAAGAHVVLTGPGGDSDDEEELQRAAAALGLQSNEAAAAPAQQAHSVPVTEH